MSAAHFPVPYSHKYWPVPKPTDRVIRLPQYPQIQQNHFFTVSIHEISLEKKLHDVWRWFTCCPRYHLISIHLGVLNIGKTLGTQKMTLFLLFLIFSLENFESDCLRAILIPIPSTIWQRSTIKHQIYSKMTKKAVFGVHSHHDGELLSKRWM